MVYSALAVSGVLLLLLAAYGGRVAGVVRGWESGQALDDFRVQREQLEARFFDMASTAGKPKGLRWVECDWLPEVTFARDRQSGYLTAFVAVNIRFEAIEGSDMEDVEAVGTIRDASAVFHYHRGSWGTGGRALFNMHPADAVERLQGQYEPIAAKE